MNYFIKANSEKEYIQQANQQLKPMGMIIDEKKKLWVYNEMDGSTYEAGELITEGPNSQPYLKLEPDKIKIKKPDEIKLITLRIINEIDWKKIRQPKLEKDENDRIWATLTVPLKKKTYYIQLLIHEKDKTELEKMDFLEITESFIYQKLTSRGKNGYFEDACPECEQPTLTKLPIMGDHGEAIACAFCNWANSLEKYLDYKKESSPLSYGEWLNKRNRYYSK
jgi:hypothetical protein